MAIVKRDWQLSVEVPEHMREQFAAAQEKVDKYFSMREEDHLSGRLKLGNNRHVLIRGDALSYDFFQTVYEIYGNTHHSNEVGLSLMFDVAHAAGAKDAEKFNHTMQFNNPIEKLAVGPIYFAHTGFARVVIHENSNPVDNDDFVLYCRHENSFECDSWLSNNVKPENCCCIFSAGYSSGWCSESFGLPLVAVEYQCVSANDKACEFVMAPPHRIDDYLSKITPDYHDRLYVPRFFGRKQTEEQLQRLAYQDILTGLTNRAMLNSLAEQLLKLAARQKTFNVGILYMDLDGFKAINDNYSHQAGDSTLCAIADRLVENMRDSDIICRYGGDEFVAMVYGPKSETDLLTLSKKIIEKVNQPIPCQNQTLHVGISIGALFIEGGQPRKLEKLLAIADHAMYQAKQKGKNQVFFGEL
jgi:diguanylate cyclase (GGDEF)-like protein